MLLCNGDLKLDVLRGGVAYDGGLMVDEAEGSEGEDGLRRGERKGAFSGVRRRRLGSRSSML